MTEPSQHLSVLVDRPDAEVYAWVAEPEHLPAWAAGLGGSGHRDGDAWVSDSPMGEVRVRFADRNDHGVLDHWVTLPSGETVYNPLRVLPHGDGCEVVFSLRRGAGMSDADLERDAAAVRADLRTLAALMAPTPAPGTQPPTAGSG